MGTSLCGGIIIAGNLVVDSVKNITSYPSIGMLTNIEDITKGVGGCAANTSIDLAKLDPALDVRVIGRVGKDENGEYILDTLSRYGIATDKIKVTEGEHTSFTDVMSLASGERTFFHKRGANATFCPDDIRLSDVSCGIFHIGYILLLDSFDQKDAEYGTVMARFLHSLQQKGIATSIDVVSADDPSVYKEKIVPALKYTNYAIINEIEATGIWGLPCRREDGSLWVENVRLAMEKMVAAGVSDKVVVHAKDAGMALDAKTGEFAYLPSLKLPSDKIMGSVGAGDAFCAGALYGIYHGYENEEILQFASKVAAVSLFAANATDGVVPKEEVLRLTKDYER